MSKPQPTELEYKFTPRGEVNETFSPAEFLRSFMPGTGSPRERCFEDSYVDTPGYHFHRAGLRCRFRRSGQDEVTITIKSVSAFTDGFASRMEFEETVRGSFSADLCEFPRGDLWERFEPILGTGRVVPLLTIRQKQALCETVVGLDCRVEVSVEHVGVPTPEGEPHFAEVELELLSGDPEAFQTLAREVRSSGNLEASVSSKFDRASRLSGLVLPLPPLKNPLPMDGDTQLPRAAGFWGAHYLEVVRWLEPGARLGFDPEYLHDMRVALLRLCTVMKLFEPVVAQKKTRALRREVREFRRRLAEVRDMEVFLDLIRRERGADQYLFALSAELEKEVLDLRLSMLRNLDSSKTRSLLKRVEAWAAARAEECSNETIRGFAQETAEKIQRKLIRDFDQMTPNCKDQRLHRLRRRTKEARYAFALFSDHTPRVSPSVMQRLARLQGVLGEHQDAVVALERLQTRRGIKAPSPGWARLETQLKKRMRARRLEAFQIFQRGVF